MVFEWFFKKKTNDSFERFKQIITDLEVIEKYIDDLLQDKKLNEQSVKQKIEISSTKLKNLFDNYKKLLNEQKQQLQTYIDSSLTEQDYLSDISKINSQIELALQEIFRITTTEIDLLTLLEKINEALQIIKLNSEKLEMTMKEFERTAKESLEMNCNIKSTGKIDLRLFKSKVKRVGAIVTQTAGSHYKVEFNGFSIFISPAQGENNVMRGKTLRDSLRTAKPHIIESFNKLNARVNQEKFFEYLTCYLEYNIKEFDDIFEKKYIKIFTG